MEYGSPLQQAWLTLLDRYEWQWFCTFTFREKRPIGCGITSGQRLLKHIHPETADKLFRVWLSKLNRAIYGTYWYKKKDQGVYWVKASEQHKSGAIHFHALLADIKNLNHQVSRLHWMEQWNLIAGFARIEEPASAEMCARYVSKYVVKDGVIECSKNLRSYARIDSVLAV